MRVMSQLIKRFIEILASIPPQEEYISQQSRRYWLNREHLENMNREIRESSPKTKLQK